LSQFFSFHARQIMPFTKRQKKGEEDATTVYEVIDRAKQEISAIKDAESEIEAAITRLKQQEEDLPDSRSSVSKKRLLKHNAKILEEERERIRSNHYESALETKISSYVSAYRNHEAALQSISKKRKNIADSSEIIEEVHHEMKTLSQSCCSALNLAPPTIKLQNDDSNCPKCGGEVRIQSAKSTLNCQVCGYSCVVLDTTTSGVSFGDEVTFNQSFSYKRSNHFMDWLMRTQYKETYQVADSVVQAVMQELALRKVGPDSVNQKRVLEIMKSKKMKSKCYNYAAQITARITGVPPPRLTSEQDQIANLLFIAIQQPFAVHQPSDRKNFLSYGYCIYRIYQLLGADELLETLPLLTGKGKIPAQDQIMEKIYKDLNWDWPGPLEV